MMNDDMNRVSAMGFVASLLRDGAEVFFVGGCVRDALRGATSKDVDLLVRGVPVEDVEALLAKHGKVNAVGKSFGVLKFTPDEDTSLEVDVAMPRTERSTGPGHRDFEIMTDHLASVVTDLARRDFTMNAIAVNVDTGERVDPFEGMVDIARKQVRTLRSSSFLEDPLRILRAVQFCARFDMQPTGSTASMMRRDADLLSSVSKERVAMEMVKLLKADKPSTGLRLLSKTVYLQRVLPGVLDFATGDALPEQVDAAEGLTARVATLLQDLDPGTVGGVFHRVPFHTTGEVDQARVERAVRLSNRLFTISLTATLSAERLRLASRAAQRRLFVEAGGREGFADMLDVMKARGHDLAALRAFGETCDAPLDVKGLVVNGKDVMAVTGASGPAVGDLLRHLHSRVVDGLLLNVKTELVAAIQDTK